MLDNAHNRDNSPSDGPSPIIMQALVDEDIAIKAHRLHEPLTSRDFFDAVLMHSGSNAAKRFSLTNLTKPQRALAVLAIICLFSGSYFSLLGLKSVKASTVQTAKITKLVTAEASASTSAATTSGNAPNSALSTAKITSNTLASYNVSPSNPRYLLIPKLHVDARVLAVGAANDGTLDTPTDVYDTAWYQGSSEPGSPGAMVIDGHVSSWTTPGVFYGLKSLQPGDNLQVVRGDGQVFNYSVVKTVVYPANNVNMLAVISPVVPKHPGLNLISCTGNINPKTSQFNERVVVFSEQT